MKTALLFFLLFSSDALLAQKGDELLVYSLTGNVTVVENNSESRVRIGKVLKPGALIKTQRAAKLTMVCKQGKPISVTRQGVFPIEKWKDSCETNDNSMTTKYFQFIWDQLYVRSDDYKKEHPGMEVAVSDAPVRGQDEVEIYLNEYLDTVNYSSGNFPLTWTTNKPYDGKYYFTLRNVSKKTIYRDSLVSTGIDLGQLKKWMRPGSSYTWTVSLSNDTGGEGGVIRYLTTSQVTRQINKLKKMVNVPEEPAAQYFRLGYLLRESRFAVNAYEYFRKAAEAAPDVELYNEKLDEFRKSFGIK